jgi:peptidoglycan/LPS O-acetylase OafA/YrhL
MSSGRIPELDGIRGLAIALVLWYHFVVDPFHAFGSLAFTGVDLFFVLSGFLIGGILLDSRTSSDYFRKFYVRRFFRIAPVYAVFLLLGGYFAYRKHQLTGPWYLYPLFLQNFWMAKADALGFLGISWSLAVEEQFYLTLPAIIRYAANLRWLLIGGIVSAPLIRAFLFYRVSHGSSYVLCRADALLLGVAGAMLARSPAYRDWVVRRGFLLWFALLIFLVGLIPFTVRPAWITGIQMRSIGLTWIALLYLSLLLLAVSGGNAISRLLCFAPLRALGQIAYCVYLVHYPLLLGVQILRPAWPLRTKVLAAAALTFAVAPLSWFIFEKPLIAFGHRLTAKSLAPARQQVPLRSV